MKQERKRWMNALTSCDLVWNCCAIRSECKWRVEGDYLAHVQMLWVWEERGNGSVTTDP